MLFNYRYHGQSVVEASPESTAMTFAPDTLRQPTYFSGQIARSIPFREAISALHDVVVSDLRYQAPDKSAYKEWAAQQELVELTELVQGKDKLQKQFDALHKEITALRSSRAAMMAPFFKARQKYFDYLYKRDYNAWFVLDPVITIHPDEIFFECFSKDESTYGRLSCGYEIFRKVHEFECGTTNVDYSTELYNEFQKIRTYKETDLHVDPTGFEVKTEAEDAYKEVKIDLPESWVRGFLQVSSAMTMPARKVELHPMDIHNFCFILRRYKERVGPRSMRYCLSPDKPVRVIFEPWNIDVTCPRSIYQGKDEEEIRVWGRRRLLVLERLIPVAQRFTVFLLGSGMPSFYVADCGNMTFTLGLSGWTANDWSKMGNFDLMMPRGEVDDFSKQQIFQAFKKQWSEKADSLAQRLQVDRSLVLSTLTSYTQAGRVMYDLAKEVFRVRELSREPLPMAALRFSSPREEEAHKLLENKCVSLGRSFSDPERNIHLEGTVKDKSKEYKPELWIDSDDALRKGKCSCNFYTQNKLHKGPCTHMLAVRIAFNQKLKRYTFW
ncbi:SWIM zinc finger family protein [candidate division CSSED10-310 bacterium]|uniref:SWIM zinc finger family protein n=1 Tax=candidate division CSSED10-310 bacterium TaxID=2855610 RepID=A0ABV6YS59_UNCC1